ncbi:MAG: TlpA family protein disulfide reductase [Akkermansiaceae bacterium]|nr:TlpA family protein disulfide reductase [Armatimonadota bacterium]
MKILRPLNILGPVVMTLLVSRGVAADPQDLPGKAETTPPPPRQLQRVLTDFTITFSVAIKDLRDRDFRSRLKASLARKNLLLVAEGKLSQAEADDEAKKVTTLSEAEAAERYTKEGFAANRAQPSRPAFDTVVFSGRGKQLLWQFKNSDRRDDAVELLYDGTKSVVYRHLSHHIEERRGLPPLIELTRIPPPLPGINLSHIALLKPLQGAPTPDGGAVSKQQVLDITTSRAGFGYAPAAVVWSSEAGRAKVARITTYYGTSLGTEWVYTHHRPFRGVLIADRMIWRQYDGENPVTQFEYRITDLKETGMDAEAFDASRWMVPGTDVTTQLADGRMRTHRLRDPEVGDASTKEYNSHLLPVGTTAPSFTLPDINDTPRSLTRLLEGNKATLVTFWYCRCPGCILEFPSLQDLHTRFQSRGLNVVGINFGDDPPAIRKFLKARGADFLILKGDKNQQNSVFDKYKVEVYPTTYLLDDKGTVAFRTVGYDVPGLATALRRMGFEWVIPAAKTDPPAEK